MNKICNWCEGTDGVGPEGLCIPCWEIRAEAVAKARNWCEGPKRLRQAQALEPLIPDAVLVHPNKEWERTDRARVMVDSRLRGTNSDPDSGPQCSCGYYHYGMC